MSFLGAWGNVGLFVGKRSKHEVSEKPQNAGLVLGTCDLPNCRQPATRVLGSVRVDDGPLPVGSKHASDVHRWVG